jgi:hypothetical protein
MYLPLAGSMLCWLFAQAVVETNEQMAVGEGLGRLMAKQIAEEVFYGCHFQRCEKSASCELPGIKHIPRHLRTLGNIRWRDSPHPVK